MANIDSAFGLRPIRHFNGNPWNGATKRYLIEDNYGTAVFTGDPVILTGAAASDDASQNYPPVNHATEGDAHKISGVVTSIVLDPSNLDRTYIPATTGGYVNVCTDPDVIFAIQDDGGAALTGASIGANACLASGTGSTIFGLSGWELAAATTPAANASYQLLILGLCNEPGNDVGVNCNWEVLISNHTFRTGMAASNEGALGI